MESDLSAPRSGGNRQSREKTGSEMMRSGVTPGRPFLQSEGRIVRGVGITKPPIDVSR